MKYFTASELLNRRLVSKAWNKCAIIRYRTIVPMTLTTSEQDMGVITDTYKSLELGSVVTALKINTRMNRGIYAMLTRIGTDIQDLEVQMTKTKKSSTIILVSLLDLEIILEQLPNVKRLTIRNLPKSLPNVTFIPNTTLSKLVYIGLDQPSTKQPQYTKSFLEQLLRGPNVTTIGILSNDTKWNNGVRPILKTLQHFPKPRIDGLMYSIDFGGSVRSSDLDFLAEKYKVVSMTVGTCKIDSNVLNTALTRMYDSLVHFTMDVLIGGEFPLIFPIMEDLVVLNILCTRRLIITDAPSRRKLFPKLIEVAGNEYLFQKLFMNGSVYQKTKTCKLSFSTQLEGNNMSILNVSAVFPNLTKLIVDADCSWCGIKGIVTSLPKLNKLVYTFGNHVKMGQWVRKQMLTEVLSFHDKGKLSVSIVNIK